MTQKSLQRQCKAAHAGAGMWRRGERWRRTKEPRRRMMQALSKEATVDCAAFIKAFTKDPNASRFHPFSSA
jgi:hypothetical protein